jgi:hypothetical protein
MQWKGDRLYVGTRSSGYSIVPDKRYPQMWRVRHPNGSLSDMINRTRAKDAAMAMLGKDIKGPPNARAGTARSTFVTSLTPIWHSPVGINRKPPCRSAQESIV